MVLLCVTPRPSLMPQQWRQGRARLLAEVQLFRRTVSPCARSQGLQVSRFHPCRASRRSSAGIRQRRGAGATLAGVALAASDAGRAGSLRQPDSHRARRVPARLAAVIGPGATARRTSSWRARARHPRFPRCTLQSRGRCACVHHDAGGTGPRAIDSFILPQALILLGHIQLLVLAGRIPYVNGTFLMIEETGGCRKPCS